MANRKNENKRTLTNLTVESVHLVGDPAIEETFTVFKSASHEGGVATGVVTLEAHDDPGMIDDIATAVVKKLEDKFKPTVVKTGEGEQDEKKEEHAASSLTALRDRISKIVDARPNGTGAQISG